MLLALDISNYLFPAGMLLLAAVLLRLTLRRLRSRSRRPQPLLSSPAATGHASARHGSTNRPDTPAASHQHYLAQHPLASLHAHDVELHDILREIRADVATRIGLLEQHTLAARLEAQRLEAAIAQARELGIASVGDPLAALEEALAAAGSDDDGAALDAALARISAALAPTTRPADRTALWQLAAQGHTAESIARQLELPLGDVELLLHLGPRSS